MPFAMVIADATGQAVAVNKRWLELSGMGRAASFGQGWLTVLDPESRSRVRDDALRVASEGGTATADYQLGGAVLARWTRWWISAHDLDGKTLLAIALADVHEDYAREANLYHLATHDSLTGLLNRSYFVEAADQALRRGERHARHVGMVFVDLDGFKRVNDIGGHSLGDRVLYAVGARLRHSVRSADLVARIGGDEFAVLCEDLVAADQAQVVAERIAAALAESVELDGRRWTVAASVGAAVDHGSPDSAEELLDRADRAMYEIKAGRRTEPLNVAPVGSERERSSAGAATATATAVLPERPERERGEDRRQGSGERHPTDRGYTHGVAATNEVRGAHTGVVNIVDRAGESVSTNADQAEAESAVANAAEAPGVATKLEVAEAPIPNAAAADVRHHLLTDIMALRDSLDAIRERLGRLSGIDASVIDIRNKESATEPE